VQLLLISAGFDAHVDDPLANLNLTSADFGRVTARLCAVAAALPHRCPVVSVLEVGDPAR
jgi:acetoin utilization deacetylase AcuC-like enzyme